MSKPIRERDIERHLCERTKALGGHAYKWVSPGRNGVPDRLVILPYGKLFMVELKAPGAKPTALQALEHTRLAVLGCKVWVLDSIECVDAFLEAAAK